MTSEKAGEFESERLRVLRRVRVFLAPLIGALGGFVELLAVSGVTEIAGRHISLISNYLKRVILTYIFTCNADFGKDW